MSKSLGNVINPIDIVSEYGTDALRYFLLREISSFEDGDFTIERFKEAYNANLANGLGNLASRIMKMAESNLDRGQSASPEIGGLTANSPLPEEFVNLLNKYELQKACDYIWGEISRLDTLIQSSQPFKLIKTEPEKAKDIITDLVIELYKIAKMLNPILPSTSDAIKQAIKANKSFTSPLFPRKD
jgi:methionyl-tRNA synthetase